MEEVLLNLGPFSAAAVVAWRWIRQMTARVDRLEQKLDDCQEGHKKNHEVAMEILKKVT